MRDTTKEAILWGVLGGACIGALMFCLTGCTASNSTADYRQDVVTDVRESGLPFSVKAFCYHGQEYLMYRYRGGLVKTGAECTAREFSQ